MLKDAIAKKMKEQGEGFRCSDLARKTKIPHETILQITKGGTKNPGVYTVAKIAYAFNSSVDELIGNIPQNPSFNVKIKNPTLFLKVMEFVLTKIKKKPKRFDSSDLFKTIFRIYSYSNSLDKTFANWCVGHYIFKEDS